MISSAAGQSNGSVDVRLTRHPTCPRECGIVSRRATTRAVGTTSSRRSSYRPAGFFVRSHSKAANEWGTYRVLLGFVNAPRKAKVGNHELTLIVDQQVGGLHVAMQDQVLRSELRVSAVYAYGR